MTTDSVSPADYRRALVRDVRSRHPGFREAVMADAQVSAKYRGDRHEYRSRLDAAVQVARLCWRSDAFLAQVLYRAKARGQALGIPLLPRLLHRLAMIFGQVCIGDPVVVKPGIYILHGQVVVDGFTEIGSGVTLAPFVTIGLRKGNFTGPVLGEHVQVGTGARIIGPVRVGANAAIGANAVVVDDVDPGQTVTGVPARPTRAAG